MSASTEERTEQEQRHDLESKGVHVAQATLIGRDAGELYAFWRDFRNFPTFMRPQRKNT